MVRIRLRRVGSKRQASFRIIAADKESPRDGRFATNGCFARPRRRRLFSHAMRSMRQSALSPL